MIRLLSLLLVSLLILMPFSLAQSLENSIDNKKIAEADKLTDNTGNGGKVGDNEEPSGQNTETLREASDNDDFGRLKVIREGNNPSGGIIEEYVYDGNGDRIKTYNHINNETTYTPFREFTMIVNESGQFNYTYIYDGSDTLVSRVNPDGSKWYYHADHLGSTTLITNESGDVVEEVFYEPYGKPESDVNSESKLYENKILDNECQYQFGSRYYNPCTGLFIQPDTLIPDIYDPQQLNIYAFERGNPYSYTDPSGNIPIWDIVDFAFIFYGLYNFISSPSLQTGAELALDVGFAAAPFVPNVDRIAEGASALNKANNVGDAGKAADLGSFTQKNFRENVKAQTGALDVGKEVQAHHNIPQKFADKASAEGINIHDPKFGSLVETKYHQRTSRAVNKQFEEFFIIKRTGEEIINKAREVSKQFGFNPRF